MAKENFKSMTMKFSSVIFSTVKLRVQVSIISQTAINFRGTTRTEKGMGTASILTSNKV